MRWRGRAPLVSVVVPVHDVAPYLGPCLDSLLASTHRELEIVVVDDGSTDSSGAIADAYAAAEPRITVVHTDNHGLGAARNEGLRHASGEFLGFADSDDVVPQAAYAVMLASLRRSNADLVTASMARWADGRLVEPPWMRRLHREPRRAITVAEHPEILGDVFAWNKLWRRSAWDAAGLAWPEGVRYEDQPTTTRALLAGRFDVLPDVVYHWRIREDRSSITQQRSSLADLADRLTTKRLSLASVDAWVAAGGDPVVRDVMVDRVLAGDLHRYLDEIPGCSPEWWSLLVGGVRELWGDRSLTRSGLLPVHRLVGWLVEQDRQADAAAVVTWAAGLGRPPDRTELPGVGPALVVPVLDARSVDPAALALRPHEV